MPKLRQYYRLLIAGLTVIALSVSNSVGLQQLESIAYGLFSRALPEKQLGQDVAVVAIDEKSRAEFGKWPWSPQSVSRLIGLLDSVNVAVQGYLPPFVYPQLAQQDSFHTVLAKTQNLVTSASYHLTENGVVANWPVPMANLTISNPNDQFVVSVLRRWVYGQRPGREWVFNTPSDTLAIPPDSVGAVQRMDNGGYVVGDPLLIANYQQVVPSFSLLVTAKILSQPLNNIRLTTRQSLKLGRHEFNLDNNYRYLPYPSDNTDGIKKLKVYSAADVMSNKALSRKLKNKAIIIGVTDQINGNNIAMAGGETVSLPIWTAYVVQSMLDSSFIWQPSWSLGLQKALVIFCMFYLMYLPSRFRGKIGVGMGAAVFLLLLNIELLALLVYRVWLPLVLPALFVILGHLLVFSHYRVCHFVQRIQQDMSRAYLELAGILVTQGKLGEAFEKYQKCEVNNELLQELYHLGIEHERRRQFSKAIIVYEYIGRFDRNYRDIKERRERHFTASDKISLIGTFSGSFSETLVVDDPNVAQPVLGRYEVIESIGKGAMGAVFLGKDPKIGRTVAIKTLPLSKEFDTQQLDEVRKRFLREAETAGRLSHPNIVTIYDVGEEHDLAYIAMDYIAGSSLDKFTRPGYLLSIEEVFLIGITVAEALDYAHEQSVVHRDIKPGNVMYNPDQRIIKVTDFGIACLTDNSRTMTGTVLGSPSYMSPEQLEGKKLDGRSDIFSLGVTIYQLFTGTLPFTADTMAALAYKIANEKPMSIRKVRAELPACLTRVINKALEKKPSQRFQTGAALAEALKKCAP